MAKLLLNADGKVLMKDDKIYKAPEVADTLGKLLNDTLTNYSNSEATEIKPYLFYKNTNILKIDFPNATIVGREALWNCKNLKQINLPKVTEVGQSAFTSVGIITDLNIFPKLKKIGAYAFDGCTIKNIENNTITSVGTTAFRGCDIKNFILYNATDVQGTCLDFNRNVELIKLPKVNTLQKLWLNNYFYFLKEVYINNATQIYSNALKYSRSLKKVYIEQTNSVCLLTNVNVFEECYHILGIQDDTYNPNGDKDGYIYVPASRLAEYKNATNWVTYESQIIGHQDFNVGDTLPIYTNETFTTQTWYSDEALTTPVTSVATTGKYYLKLEA